MYKVRLLGPVEVIGPAGPAGLTGARQRTLVALLALRPGASLSTARLAEGMWGEDPPRTAHRTLHSHFARARQALLACGMPDLLTTTKSGHTLAIPPQVVDAHRFIDHLAQGRQRLAVGDVDGAAADLRAGLDLWSGEALQDAEPAGWALGELDRLAEARLSAVEELCECRIRFGENAAAAADLRALLVAHPLRERVVSLLMLALYRDARPAEALDVYQRLREHLADALGVDPSPELERLYIAMLRQDASLGSGDVHAVAVNPAAVAPAARPAQLPPRAGHFTGRHAELDALDRVPPGAVVLITGGAGMGKSTLAIEWAHRVRDKYPDGHIHLDLGGHSADEALATADVFAHALRALGVATDRMPTTVKEQAAMYRSLLHGRRMLLFLDNVHSAQQVLPLVPAEEESLCLLTSRRELVPLAVRHAVHLVELGPLTHADSLALLRDILGPGRLVREPVAADELVTLCGGLPLALRIAAAKLATRVNMGIAGLVADLAEHRLDQLSAGNDGEGIRSVFASAYSDITGPAARTFRLLGLHPGPTMTSHLAAAITNMPVALADRSLDELTTAHLTTQLDDDRYRFHDLIRWYARERAETDETPEAREEALARLFDWYLGVCATANKVLDPRRDRVEVKLRHELGAVPFGQASPEVLSFLDGERSNLAPVVAHATASGYHVAAWQMTYLLVPFHEARGEWDRPQLCRSALAAALALEDPVAEGLIRNIAGTTEIAHRRFAEALEQLELAVALSHRSGDERCRASAYNNMAVALIKSGRLEDALVPLHHAREIYEAQVAGSGLALAHINIAHVHIQIGQVQRAFAHLDEALTLAQATDNQRIQATVAHNRGEALASAGDHAAARVQFEEAIARRRATGDKWRESYAVHGLSLSHLELGMAEAALSGFRRVVSLSREVGNHDMEAVALGNLGRIYLQLHDPVAAGRHLQAAMRLRLRVPDAQHEAQLRELMSELDQRSDSPRLGKAEPVGARP